MFCTCNEACSGRVVDNIKPTHLIIDEAAMATEPEAMIPIQLADHVTLIGDHMQLQVCIAKCIVLLGECSSHCARYLVKYYVSLAAMVFSKSPTLSYSPYYPLCVDCVFVTYLKTFFITKINLLANSQQL